MSAATTSRIHTALLERAASEPFGLAIETNNAKRLQINLCNAQRAMGEDTILVCLPSAPDTVFLVKRSVELDP